MSLFETIHSDGHEQVVFFQDSNCGLKAIVAIHDTTLGPALGGARMWTYASEDEAIKDALRLAKGMTFKAAAAGLKLGGGKAVIMGNPKEDKSELLFRAFGRCVNTLGGRYITAEDVGTDVIDMEYVYMETPYVTGVDTAHGGSGNPAPFTAYGVYQGIKSALEFKTGKKSCKDLKIAVQGLGQVGWNLAKMLVKEGAIVFATDIDSELCKRAKDELKIQEIVHPDEIYSVNCDIFTPCALGSVINDKTIDQLKCKIIAGAANNQLDQESHGDILQKKGILYAPDYIVNAGGLINVYVELEGYSRERALRLCRSVYYNTKKVCKIAQEENISTHVAADRLVKHRLDALRKLQPHFNVFPREKFDKRR